MWDVKSTMDENQINKYLRKIEKYQGSFASDELNEISIKTFPEYVIVNLDSRSGGGNHWIALAIYENSVYICDPLGGIKPDIALPTELINFLHVLLTSRKLYMTKQLQPLRSDTCALYCIKFILCMSETNSFKNFLRLFTNDYQQNEVIIKFLLNQ